MKNHPATETEYFKTIEGIIYNLKNSGMLDAGSGYCVSMSDIVHKLLHKEGIKSQIVECSLMVSLKDPPGLFLMGYPGFNQNNFDKDKMLSTHVVCITETEVPILIDLSVGNIDSNISFICAPIVKNYSHTNLAEFDFITSTWTYTKKQDTEMELPKLHQRSILDRIKLDNQIQSQIGIIQKLVVLALSVSCLNFIRGGYDFYQKYINQTNGFGPTRTNVITNNK
jgi:hypothetical protein